MDNIEKTDLFAFVNLDKNEIKNASNYKIDKLLIAQNAARRPL